MVFESLPVKKVKDVFSQELDIDVIDRIWKVPIFQVAIEDLEIGCIPGNSSEAFTFGPVTDLKVFDEFA